MIEKIISSIVSSVNPTFGSKVKPSASSYEDFHYQLSFFFQIQDAGEQEKYIQAFKQSGYFERVEKTGKGFLSLKFKVEELAKIQTISGKPKTVLVDYCGVNVAKQMHIGHIRSMFIGDAQVRFYERLGHKVIIQNHVGDWGNQFGYLIEYMKQEKLELHSNKELTQAYKASYELYQTDPEFALRAQECAGRLQKSLEPELSMWRHARDISLAEAGKTFEEFKLIMKLSDTQGESFYAAHCPLIIEELIQKGVAKKEEDGSVVAFFQNKSPMVLQKSNGNYLYSTYDLAAIRWRLSEYDLEKIVYVVDKRQTLHFQQVFDLAVRAGWAQPHQLQHAAFGTILGKDKKPLKTKSGESLYLDELLAQGRAQFEAGEHYTPELLEYDIEKKTVIGALKYYDLHLGLEQDYIFDWDFVLNTKGNSAPYVQNAYVRIDSILYQAQKKQAFQHTDLKIEDIQALLGEANTHLSTVEKQNVENLIFQNLKILDYVNEYQDKVDTARITEATQLIARQFHKFYEHTSILGHAQEKELLTLIDFVAQTLFETTQVLGIEVYGCMDRLRDQKKNKQQSAQRLKKRSGT